MTDSFDMGMLLRSMAASLVRIQERGPGGRDMDELVLILGEMVEVLKHLAEIEGLLGLDSELTRMYAEARRDG